MKYLRFLYLGIISVMLFSQQTFPINRHSITARKQIRQLQKIAESGMPMFGHQDALLYGYDFHSDKKKQSFVESDVKDVCGDYPALLGLDLGHTEVANINLDDQYTDNIIKAAIEHHRRGGVITISWHADNPVTGKSVFDVSDTTVVDKILRDKEVQIEFYKRLSKVADILDRIRDDRGRLIPIIFRPYHEMNHAGFWWSRWWASPDDFKSLWILTYNYLVKTRGLNNLLWAYSPSNVRTERSFLSTYPGDRYVDVVCYEKYQEKGKREDFIKEMQEGLAFIEEFAKAHRKIPAIAECGIKSVSEPDWWTQSLLPVLNNAHVAYLLVWRNAGKSTEFYGPYKGHTSEKDFLELYNLKKMTFLSDLQ